MRAPLVTTTLQYKHRIKWDVTDGRNGGAERTVWEALLEMKSFNLHAGEKDQGAVALVLDLAKAFERVSLPVVWACATHFNLPRKILLVLRVYFEHQRRFQFEGCPLTPQELVPDLRASQETKPTTQPKCQR